MADYPKLLNAEELHFVMTHLIGNGVPEGTRARYNQVINLINRHGLAVLDPGTFEKTTVSSTASAMVIAVRRNLSILVAMHEGRLDGKRADLLFEQIDTRLSDTIKEANTRMEPAFPFTLDLSDL